MQHHQVVAEHGAGLGVDRRVGAEHGLAVVAAHGVVVHAHARTFEQGAVADEAVGTLRHAEGERPDRDARHGDLTQRLVALDVEDAAQRVVERDLRAAVAAAHEEYACAEAGIEPLPGVGTLPARLGAGCGLAHPARHVVAVAQRLGRGLVLHDVVGRPAPGLGLHRAAEVGEGRSHRCEARAAASVMLLQPFAQVGGEDVALDERVAQHGDAHVAAVEQLGIERMQRAAACGVEVLDRHHALRLVLRFDALAHLGHGGGAGHQAAVGRAGTPLEGGADLAFAHEGVGGFDLRRDVGQVHAELLLVEHHLRGALDGGLLETHEVREDVRTAQRHAAHGAGRYKAHAAEHCEQRHGGEPCAVGVILFGIHQSRRPRIRNT